RLGSAILWERPRLRASWTCREAHLSSGYGSRRSPTFSMPINLQILQITLQALSSFAIAGGLIFTAIQFKQARQAQVVANFSKLVELQYQLRQIRVYHPSLASVHKLDVEHLHSEREIQDYFLNLMQLSLFEIAWYAHKN